MSYVEETNTIYRGACSGMDISMALVGTHIRESSTTDRFIHPTHTGGAMQSSSLWEGRASAK